MKRASYLLALLPALPAFSEPIRVDLGSGPLIPPPAPPIVTIPAEKAGVHAFATVYSIGDPTPEEQLYLELINRARANPPAEGVRLANTDDPAIASDLLATGIDLNLLQSQFAALSAVQPLAMNAKLTTAARNHSLDMFNNVFQDHVGSNGSTLSGRLVAAGYFGSAGENVYSYAKSTAHGHAAFEVDWGGPASNGGMQSPPGHRDAIHNPLYREVGVGVVLGSNQAPGKTPVGPHLVTQDFGVQQGSTPFITGVAYFDLNGNNFYDLGEGIGDVHVTVAQNASEGMTARSGGYAVPVPGNGTYTVTFSRPGLAAVVQTVTVVGSKNLKLDFAPSYAPPLITGPTAPAIGRPNLYSVASVQGTASQWRVYQEIPALPEGAENDTNNVSIIQSRGYDVIQGILIKSGSFAFHLATPEQALQYITLSPTYLITAQSSLSFQSQLGLATPAQHALVQISADDGLSWETIYDQPGTYNLEGASPPPEESYTLRTAGLAKYSGKAVRVRFVFAPLPKLNERFISSADLNIGWLIDDIQISNARQIANARVSAFEGSNFAFQPDVESDFSLQARVKVGHDFLPWGLAFKVHSAVTTDPTELRLNASYSNGLLQIVGDLVSGGAPANITLESRETLTGAWQTESVAVQVASPSQFRATMPVTAAARSRFFRFRAE